MVSLKSTTPAILFKYPSSNITNKSNTLKKIGTKMKIKFNLINKCYDLLNQISPWRNQGSNPSWLEKRENKIRLLIMHMLLEIPNFKPTKNLIKLNWIQIFHRLNKLHLKLNIKKCIFRLFRCFTDFQRFLSKAIIEAKRAN